MLPATVWTGFNCCLERVIMELRGIPSSLHSDINQANLALKRSYRPGTGKDEGSGHGPVTENRSVKDLDDRS